MTKPVHQCGGLGVVCPNCGCRGAIVLETRPGPEHSTRRRKECQECGARYTTYELILPVSAHKSPALLRSIQNRDSVLKDFSRVVMMTQRIMRGLGE